MTCIVGFLDKENDVVIMGADSAGVAGSLIMARKDTKLFKNGDFVIGCTSSFRMIQLLRFSFKPPVINDKDIYEYMCTDFINEVRKCFTDGGYIQKQKDGDEKGGTFLVAYKNRLFQIDEDFQVGENIDGFASVGCGVEYALGAIYSTDMNEVSPEKIVLRALKAAEHFSTGVCRPFIFETTQQ